MSFSTGQQTLKGRCQEILPARAGKYAPEPGDRDLDSSRPAARRTNRAHRGLRTLSLDAYNGWFSEHCGTQVTFLRESIRSAVENFPSVRSEGGEQNWSPNNPDVKS